MSLSCASTWGDELLARYPIGQPMGEDLRYDDSFTRLKNENSAISPNAQWMLEESFSLLEKSADCRVCIYALHAASILGDKKAVVDLLRFYSELMSNRFDESYPLNLNQKLGTFDWCLNSYIVTHIKKNQNKYTEQDLELMSLALDKIHQTLDEKTGEINRWHDLQTWLFEQRNSQSQSQSESVNEPNSEPLILSENSVEVRPLFDKFVSALLKEGQYERAVGLARAHRWGELKTPEHKEGKTTLEIRQASINRVSVLIEKQDWKRAIEESEALFMITHAHFYIKINLWSHQALISLNQHKAAETIIVHLKKLFRNYGQMFSFMYNEGQYFCDAQTLDWVRLHCEEVKSSNVANSSSQENIQTLLEQDVDKMKAWLQDHTITTRKEAFMRDYFQVKILKSERKGFSVAPAVKVLFERTLEEGLYHWEPELAQTIWGFYASALKEEKHQKPIDKATAWQLQWDGMTSAVARVHLPAAIELMSQI